MKPNTIIATFLSFLCPVGAYASDLHYNVRGANSSAYMNTLLSIENKGVNNTLVYSPADEALTSGSDAARIAIQNVNMGTATFGIYQGVYVEYALIEDIPDGYFEFSLDNSAYVIARIPVTKTDGITYAKGIAFFEKNIIGKHKVSITWRGHGAALKAFGFIENAPEARIKVENTGGTYKLLSADLNGIQGKHHLKLVWRNHSANIRTVYLDGEGLSSLLPDQDAGVNIYANGNEVTILSSGQLTGIKAYDMSGRTVKSACPESNEYKFTLNKGIYIIEAKANPEKVLRQKVLITK